jgi:hypothetical protein
MPRKILNGLFPTLAAIAAFPFAAMANPIITNVAETGGDNERPIR